MIYLLRALTIILFCLTYVAHAAPLFNVLATGAPNSATITLCLNGKGPLSCERIHVSALNLRINTTIPNHVYPLAGIQINTPGYTFANLGVTCSSIHNGYCLFSVSANTPKNITLLPPIGTSYAGGLVACLGDTPNMNLIATTNDLINGIPWGGFGTLTGAQSAVNGAQNSALILASGVTNSAVNLCSGSINGYNDWFLPAEDQLNCLYANQKMISGFMNAFYWSSTEDGDHHAVFQFFDNGNSISVFKTFYASVRCVRAIA